MYNQNNQNRPFLPLECGSVQKPALQRRPHRSSHTPPHRSAPKNRFFRLVSTCRQNRSFVTRRTKPGNSGRLPPSAAVQGRSSGRAASSRGGGGAECSECYGEWRSQRALLRSRAPQLRLLAAPQWCGGRGACCACRSFSKLAILLTSCFQ